MEAVANDVRVCGLFLLHLSYRSPQWLGEDFFSGMDALRLELEKAGKDMDTVIREESTRLLQTGEFVLVFSQVDAPTFVIGDCGLFVSQDTELRVDNKNGNGRIRIGSPPNKGYGWHCRRRSRWELQ